MMWGSLSAEGRFTGISVCGRGSGLPIGEPKVISLMRKGKWVLMSELSKVWCQTSTMYSVMCIYRTELNSVMGAGPGSLGWVTTEGARMCWVAWGRVIARTFDIVDDANGHSGLIDQAAIFPVDNWWLIRVIWQRMAGVCTMANGATSEAEGILWVMKGTYWLLRKRSVVLMVWREAVWSRVRGLWVRQTSKLKSIANSGDRWPQRSEVQSLQGNVTIIWKLQKLRVALCHGHRSWVPGQKRSGSGMQ